MHINKKQLNRKKMDRAVLIKWSDVSRIENEPSQPGRGVPGLDGLVRIDTKSNTTTSQKNRVRVQSELLAQFTNQDSDV